jgi:predicted NBD/HSP70 family sugar kinase
VKPILCFDVGGTSIKYGLTDDTHQGRLLHAGSLPNVIRSEGADAFVASIADMAVKMAAEQPLEGIAVSLAGVVNSSTGQLVRPSQYFPGLTQINLVDILGQKTGLPVTVENDVNCAALAEAKFGAGRGAENFLCLTLGTGIGGAIVTDGRLYRGSGFAAGEFGQAKFGSDFIWEDWASVTALLAEAKKVCPQGTEKLDGRAFFAKVAEGDEAMCSVLTEMARRWAIGLTALSWILNPDRIVIGGGISAQHELMQQYLGAALDKEMEPLLRKQTKICFAELGNTAGMIGAAVFFKEQMKL